MEECLEYGHTWKLLIENRINYETDWTLEECEICGMQRAKKWPRYNTVGELFVSLRNTKRWT